MQNYLSSIFNQSEYSSAFICFFVSSSLSSYLGHEKFFKEDTDIPRNVCLNEYNNLSPYELGVDHNFLQK